MQPIEQRNQNQNQNQQVEGITELLHKFDKFLLYISVVPFVLLAFLAMISGEGETSVQLLTYAGVFGVLLAGSRFEKEKRSEGRNTTYIMIFMWAFAAFSFFNIFAHIVVSGMMVIVAVIALLWCKVNMNSNWMTILIATFFGVSFIYALLQDGDYSMFIQLSYTYDPLAYEKNIWMYLISFLVVLAIAVMNSVEEKQEEAEEVQNTTEDKKETQQEKPVLETVEKEENITIEETRTSRHSRVQQNKQKEEEMEEVTVTVETEATTNQDSQSAKGFFVDRKRSKTLSWKEKLERKLSKMLDF